ncbi:MAG: hypothetical protein PHS41_08680 [Victivallaceae bacterium]|nr:hypothetical protein [Victivallaceae bacterium]
MPDEVVVAGSVLTWGVDPIANVGIVQKVTRNETVEVAEAKGESGKTIEERAYSSNDELSIEALIKTGVTPPAKGVVVSVTPPGGATALSYLVRSSQRVHGNSEYNTLSMTISHKDSSTLVALT